MSIRERFKKFKKWIGDKLDKFGSMFMVDYGLDREINSLTSLFGEAIGGYDLCIEDSNGDVYTLNEATVVCNGENAIYGNLSADYDDKYLVFSTLCLDLTRKEGQRAGCKYSLEISYKYLMRYIADAITEDVFKTDSKVLSIKVGRPAIECKIEVKL